jgi:hypothetical protein
MKLASQNPKGMRDLSSMWVPPIYRRLLSAEKPERDMAERCLIKVSSVILPPQSSLSKVIEKLSPIVIFEYTFIIGDILFSLLPTIVPRLCLYKLTIVRYHKLNCHHTLGCGNVLH